MASVSLFSVVESPVGRLLLTSDGVGLTGLYPETHRARPSTNGRVRSDTFFTGVRDQLDAYFAGRLTRFEVTLSPKGTAFQQLVWSALGEIPFGATVTYGELATRIGKPSASRAVGLANGRNPISLIVPCHRVVGAGGKLTGYAGGLELKGRLLEHESTLCRQAPQLAGFEPAPVHPRLSV
jgi:methylated-DNA-[protein]-cysteine S-methyltransferase